MISLLLAVIYMAFISLGLPDSLLGSAWPAMQSELNAPLPFAGIISMIITGGTIISSLMSARLTKKLGAGLVTAISVAMTAAALFGFSAAPSGLFLCLCAVPYGLGAGSVDAALNHYIALYFSARHMSWLHCFWGVGASVSPYIMGYCISHTQGWRGGYSAIFLIQIVLSILLFASLPLWKKPMQRKSEADPETADEDTSLMRALRVRGVPVIMLAFFSYCALETTIGLWTSSYLVRYRHIGVETAARYASLFYLGITAGRFLNGFVADRLGDRFLIRLGLSVTAAGILLLVLPVSTEALILAGLIVIGLGCAPVYPCVIHATPANFGREHSSAVVALQMSSAYVGSTAMPPLFGLIANHISIGLYPWYLLLFTGVMVFMTEYLNRIVRRKKA